MSTTRALTRSQLQDLEAELLSERSRLERLLRSHDASDAMVDRHEHSAFDVSGVGGARSVRGGGVYLHTPVLGSSSTVAPSARGWKARLPGTRLAR